MGWREEVQRGIENWITICNRDKEFLSIKEELLDLQEDVHDELIVMVSGEFKAGKSTFINALLGNEILTSDVTPATAVVTKLTYGIKTCVLAHYLDHSVKEYGIKWLEQLTAEKEGEFQQIREQISYIELQLPIELLKTFTIIDTPGLNSSHKHHTEATDRFLRRADVAIWLFNYRNVGTSTEVSWLKKLKEYEIEPIAIVNAIDKHDGEDDDIEDLLDDSFRRLQPFVKKLIGVSSLEALKGKLHNDPELLEWSNWSEIENIFSDLAKKIDRKMVRVFQRLKKPLNMLDEILIERKASLGANRIKTLMESFMNHDYPSLQKESENLKVLSSESHQKVNSWNDFLKQSIYTLDGMTQFIQSSYNRLSIEKQRSTGKDFLQLFDEKLLPELRVIEMDFANFIKEFTTLSENRDQLQREWDSIESSHVLSRKKRRINQHEQKLTEWKQHQDELVKKKQQLASSHKSLDDQMKRIEQLLQKSVAADIEVTLGKHRNATDAWNKMLVNTMKKYGALSLDEIKEVENFSGFVKSFMDGIIAPFQEAISATKNKLVYAETDFIMSNITALYDQIPLKQFEQNYTVFQSWKPSEPIPNNVKVRLQLPPEIEGIKPPSLPSALSHNLDKAKDELHEHRVKWASWSVVVVVVLSIILGNTIGNEDNSPAHASDSSYSEPSDEYTDTEATNNVADLQHFGRTEITDFITTLHQKRLESNSAFEFFDTEYFSYNSSKITFREYYDDLANIPLKNLEIKKIDYNDSIIVNTNETFEKNGSEYVYEAEYTLTPNSDDTDLEVAGFSYSKLTDTSLEVVVSEETIRNFMTEYRTEYMDALNRDDSSSILPYLESDQPAYKLITSYFSSIEGKGNSYTPEKFTITNVEHTGSNMYEVSTDESFVLEESSGKKTENKRERSYTVHVDQPDKLFIRDLKVLNASNKELTEPSVDETTDNQDVYGSGSGSGTGTGTGTGTSTGNGIGNGNGNGN